MRIEENKDIKQIKKELRKKMLSQAPALPGTAEFCCSDADVIMAFKAEIME